MRIWFFENDPAYSLRKIHQNMPFQSKLNLTSKYLEDTKDEKFEQSTLKESAHRENVS